MPAVQAIKKKRARRKQKNRKPLITHSTVLILSGFLIGMVFRRMVDPSIEVYVFAAGLIGVFCYLGLDWLARRRQQQAAQLELERTNHELERRINRHIPHEVPVRSSRPSSVQSGTENQYLTIVNSF